MQATKKPHNYYRTVVWQKDDRIRKSPLKFYVYYYNELSGDCQASIFTELWRLSVAFCVTLWHMSIVSEFLTNILKNNYRIDLETAKIIIEKYKQEKEK